MVMFDDVKVPWERVFVHDDPALSRALYIETAAHSYGNHHSNVRLWVKLQLLLGLASRIALANGAHEVPAVEDVLGRLAALEALLAGADRGPDPGGGGMADARLRDFQPAHDVCRAELGRGELLGGGGMRARALRRRACCRCRQTARFLQDDRLAGQFRTYWQTPHMDALSRMKLFKLAWDIIGSEFAGRHVQYEKFFPGASFIVRNHNFREAPWATWHGLVDDILERMPTTSPGPVPRAAE